MARLISNLMRGVATVSGAVVLAVACGSDDDGGENGAGAAGNGGGIDLDDGGSAVTATDGGTRVLDGGVETLRDAACAGWSVEPEPGASTLMMVVDVSTSMNSEDPSSGSNDSKWEVTQPALLDAVQGLPAAASVGLLFYPNMNTPGSSDQPRDPSECVSVDEMIPVDSLGPEGSDHRTLLQEAVQETDPFNSASTPTHDAYNFALEELNSAPATGGQRNMLLITDGQPTFSENCVGSGIPSDPVDEQPIIDEIANANANGIRTFVIGSPGSEETDSQGEDARPWLSQAAEAGGTATDSCDHQGPDYCHFDMVDEPDFGEGLRDALAEISGQIVQCSYPLPEESATGEPIDPNAVNVIFTTGEGQELLVLPNDDADCGQGWSYTDDQTQVQLCEQTCNQVQSDPQASLELLFGCETPDIPE